MNEWNQEFIEHCPKKNCKGMLLVHPEYQEMKCSNCNKYFVRISDIKEVENPEVE